MTPNEALAEIRRRVLAPAVTGGIVSIERPFGPALARAAGELLGGPEPTPERARLERELRASVDGPVEAAIDDPADDPVEAALVGRLRRLAASDVAACAPRLDGAVVTLAALLHDLVAAFHPDLPGPLRHDAPARLLSATARAFAEVPPPSTVRAALARHAWLGDLVRFSLTRTDVSWWVGGASFVGRAPPSRLLAWPDVRRVRRHERRVELGRLPELLADREGADALAGSFARALGAFFAASPVTDLTYAGRLAPPFVLTVPVARLLLHPAGARVCRRAIALGEEGGRYAREVLAQVAPAAAAALGSYP